MSQSNSSQRDREIKWLLEEKYRGTKSRGFNRDLKKLEAGEPIDYVIGFKDFLGCRISLSQKPLIPRDESEMWTEKVIKSIPKNKKIQCLDIFAGSGCIGIAVLKHLPLATVYFAEKHKKFIKQIRENIKINGISKKRIKIYESDIFNTLPETRYNYIFANPPYVSQKRKSRVQNSVLNWEPHRAILASDDGLYFIKIILKESPIFLSEKGKLYIEFDSWQKTTIDKIARKYNYKKIDFIKDYSDKWRVVVLSV